MASSSRSAPTSGDSSEWKTVPRKRTGNKPAALKPVGNNTAAQSLAVALSNELSQRSCSEILNDVHKSKISVQASVYFKFAVDSISEQLSSLHSFDTILAFGIGNLSTPTSLLQLAIYLCLCDQYLSNGLEQGRGVFDPHTTLVDMEVYAALHVPVLTENTKGKHTATGTGRTLFFLPHCPYRLYCNLLWANWEQLDSVYLYGNSIRRATSPVKLKKKAAGPGKASAKATEAFRHSEPMYHDDTDTVALLSPHIIEVDLWPPVGGYAPARASSESSGTLVNGVSPRLAFLKEAKSVAELRHLENAMCDISFMYVSPGALADTATMSSIKAMKPSEELIDEAALRDVELF